MPKFYVTIPIYYVNNLPHLGHARRATARGACLHHHIGGRFLFDPWEGPLNFLLVRTATLMSTQ